MNFIHRYQPSISWTHEINRLIDRTLAETNRSTSPRESLHESGTSWILRLDLPGLTKPDVQLVMVDRTLHLNAEAKPEQPFSAKVTRSWKLGEDVDSAAITARLENGVLELILPKRTPVTPQPTTIEIQ